MGRSRSSIRQSSPDTRRRVARLQRAAVWSSGHGLGWLWRSSYTLVARAYVAYLCRGEGDTAAFLTGSLAGPDRLYGLTDIDVAIVLSADPAGPGLARERVRRRCEHVASALPLIGLLVDSPQVFEYDDLRDATRNCTFTYRLNDTDTGPGIRYAAYGGPRSDPGKTRRLERPCLYDSTAHWRLLAGRDRRPPEATRDKDEEYLAAWLELQWWWRWAFDACIHPDRLSNPQLCVKLAAESARIWLWLEHGEQVGRRVEALARAAERLPEEAFALERMRQLHNRLTKLPVAPLADSLAILMRFSIRVAEVLRRQTEATGSTEVALLGDPADLRLPHGSWPELTPPPDSTEQPHPLPLVDWRAMVCPWEPPEESFAVLEGDPCDPEQLAAFSTLTARGTYPTLLQGGLMLRPTRRTRRGRLRAVQCAATDPVSFALVNGESIARFPNMSGLSVQHTVQRAVREHGVWLTELDTSVPLTFEALGRMVTAARSAFAWESLHDSKPALTLTVDATLEALAERALAIALGARESYEELRPKSGGGSPRLAAELHEVLSALPAYAGFGIARKNVQPSAVRQAGKSVRSSGARPKQSYWDRRRHFRYYEEVVKLARLYVPDGELVLDVGSMNTKVVDQLDWFQERVALDVRRVKPRRGVETITADFTVWEPGRIFDLVLCLQVLEHLPDPEPFARKLLRTGKTVIISVPYRWRVDQLGSHLHDPVDEHKLRKWTGLEPVETSIVQDGSERLIAVYEATKAVS
jgi:SAM-dependent methyltransferase